jgi:hypothetical protein
MPATHDTNTTGQLVHALRSTLVGNELGTTGEYVVDAPTYAEAGVLTNDAGLVLVVQDNNGTTRRYTVTVQEAR